MSEPSRTGRRRPGPAGSSRNRGTPTKRRRTTRTMRRCRRRRRGARPRCASSPRRARETRGCRRRGSSASHPPGPRSPGPAVARSDERHPDSSASTSSLERGKPVMASSTSSTGAPRRTRRSRGSQSVASLARATRMKIGAPNGAGASRRRAPAALEPGEDAPAHPGLSGAAANRNLSRQRADAPAGGRGRLEGLGGQRVRRPRPLGQADGRRRRAGRRDEREQRAAGRGAESSVSACRAC